MRPHRHRWAIHPGYYSLNFTRDGRPLDPPVVRYCRLAHCGRVEHRVFGGAWRQPENPHERYFGRRSNDAPPPEPVPSDTEEPHGR